MNLGGLAKQAKKLISDNSPALLTAIAVTGTLTTAYFAGKASFKAADIIREEEASRVGLNEEYISFTTKEKFDLVWQEYIPAAASAALTVLAIVGVNQIGTRRAAALASAASISEKAFGEYKAKVVDRMGKDKEQALRDEIVQDKIKNDPINQHVQFVGDVYLFFDAWSGREFYSNAQLIRQAQNDINYELTHNNYESLSTFYNQIGLETTQESDGIGWNANKLLEIEFDPIKTHDNRPAISVIFRTKPTDSYSRLG